MTNFKDIAKTLAPYIPDSVTLFNAAAAVESLLSNPLIGHDNLVIFAENDPVIMDYVNAGKKILAVKELKMRTGCGLKEAKDAIEDWRVTP